MCKRSRFFAALAAACLLLAGCAPKQDVPDVSAAPAPADSEPAADISKPADAASDNISAPGQAWECNYEESVNQLGPLLGTTSWQDPSEIQPSKYILWYGYRMQERSDLGQYFDEDLGCACFPAEELETEITAYFDVDTSHLRSDPALFSESDGVYLLPTALAPLSEKEVEITGLAENGTSAQISFTLHFPQSGDSEEIILTLEKTADGYHYQSYICQ